MFAEELVEEAFQDVKPPMPNYDNKTQFDPGRPWRGRVWGLQLKHSRTIFPFTKPDAAGVLFLTTRLDWEAPQPDLLPIEMDAPVADNVATIATTELGLSPVILTDNVKASKGELDTEALAFKTYRKKSKK